MSGSTAVIQDNRPYLVAPEGFFTAQITVGDERNQLMPAGTEISAEVIAGGNIVGADQFIVPCDSFDGPSTYPFLIEADDTPGSGFFVVTVTTPRGLVTTSAPIPFTIATSP
jgi:hypothetical protein